ncbi:MAG: hypothetical protein ACP5D9_10870 [Mariniphaga sp.]
MKNETLHIELLLSRDTLNLSEVADFEVGLNLINESDSPVHFDIAETELYVNDTKNIAWDLAVQNGTIVNLKVPPRKSKTVQWPLGDAMFEKPGKYRLQLRCGDLVQVKEVTVSK